MGKLDASLLVGKPPLLDNAAKARMQKLAKQMQLPFDVEATSLIEKITAGKGMSQLRAIDWMVWTMVLSPFVLWRNLAPDYLSHWMLFVRAVRLVVTPAIKRSDVETADKLFQEFIKGAPRLYGDDAVVINGHNHLHTKQDIESYASLYACWLYPYER